MHKFRALFVIAVGVALATCGGRRQATVPPEADEQYRSRILALLEADTLSGQREAGSGIATEAVPKQQVPERTGGKTEQGAAPLAESLYMSAQSRYQELQARLRARQATVDSLKRVLAAADQEIRRLNQEVQTAKTAPTRAPAAVARTNSGGTYEERYQAALRLTQGQQLRRAIGEFEALISENPVHSLADNCQYWIGQCYYDLGQYDQAIAEFLKVFSFAATDKYDDAHLMICKSYVALGEREAARAELRSFLLHHPRSEYRQTAEAMLRTLSR
ncbi:MAG: tetratricopeptide repeat protein [candidate division KSB1 bacterium]|nr:tetratricopeptide repeat protein [candidate division KSB1 bacterium]MDZ7385965.1 tetratricopeptide repeat protein [candidate division KSB1 bacterium]MDZ7412144.1 tetratricopeptide repeat protein [candidate division KSB1 bacterium]